MFVSHASNFVAHTSARCGHLSPLEDSSIGRRGHTRRSQALVSLSGLCTVRTLSAAATREPSSRCVVQLLISVSIIQVLCEHRQCLSQFNGPQLTWRWLLWRWLLRSSPTVAWHMNLRSSSCPAWQCIWSTRHPHHFLECPSFAAHSALPPSKSPLLWPYVLPTLQVAQHMLKNFGEALFRHKSINLRQCVFVLWCTPVILQKPQRGLDVTRVHLVLCARSRSAFQQHTS